MYQIGKFISPSFVRYKGRILRLLLFSVILASLGVLFAYYVSLPAALHFLANVDTQDLQSIITVNEYLNFVIGYVAGFALLFQLPLLMLFINRIKPLRPGRLMRIQRWVILISFIVAAFLTPTPDPINQAIMAFPIILLYQFSIGLIWFVNRRRKITAAEPAPVAVTPSVASAPAPAPVPLPVPAPALPLRTKALAPKKPLIMDVFWVPQNPMT
jgi:sec-independent protein translocase protein TatC